MAIDPPYRLDPLHNPVNVKLNDEGGSDAEVEGFAGGAVRCEWLFEDGIIGVFIPNGSGSLRVRVIGSSGVGSEVFGVFSGASGSNGTFTNSGDGAFTPIGGGGISGSVTAINFSGVDKTTSAATYNYGGLTFTQNNGLVYTVENALPGSYDYSNAGNVPRQVVFRWPLRMLRS